MAKSAGASEYTDCISAEGKTMSVLDITLNNLYGEVPVMLELWEMQSIPLLSSLPGLLWPGVVTPDCVLSMGQIELNCVLMLNRIIWNRTDSTFNCV